MEMRLQHDSIQMERPLGCCRETINVEGDVTLPGSLRDATEILHADAVAVVESAQTGQDRILIHGRVIFRVMYTQSSSAKTDAIEATADFTHQCDVQGVLAGSDAFACAKTAAVQAEVQGGRVHMKTEVAITARAMLCEPATVLNSVDAAGLQRKSAALTIRRTVGRGNADVLLREEFLLPAELQIQETVGASASVRMQDTAGGVGRIGMSGEILLEAVHTSSVPGKPLVVTRHTVPVSQSVEIKGETGDLLDGRMVIKDVAVASQSAEDGEVILRAEVLLGLSAWSDKKEETELLVDAYTTDGDELVLSRMPLTIRTGSTRYLAAESGKLPLRLPEDAKPIRMMLAAFASPVIGSHTQQGSRLILEGTMDTTLVYLSGDQPLPVSARMSVPFRSVFTASAGPDDILLLSVSGIDAAAMTSDRAELRYTLQLEVDGLQTETVPVVTDAASAPGKSPANDIVLYFVQPGESVWDVAKRYRITENELRALNPDLQDNLKNGDRVIAWRKRVPEGNGKTS